jgi:hypothetical protein
VANPDSEVRSSSRVHNEVLYLSARPDLCIWIRHRLNVSCGLIPSCCALGGGRSIQQILDHSARFRLVVSLRLMGLGRKG